MCEKLRFPTVENESQAVNEEKRRSVSVACGASVIEIQIQAPTWVGQVSVQFTLHRVMIGCSVFCLLPEFLHLHLKSSDVFHPHKWIGHVVFIFSHITVMDLQVLRQLSADLSYGSLVSLGIAGVEGAPVAAFEKKDALHLTTLKRMQEEVSGPTRRPYDGFPTPLPIPSWLEPPPARRKGIGLLSSDGPNDSMSDEDHDRNFNRLPSSKTEEVMKTQTATEGIDCLHLHFLTCDVVLVASKCITAVEGTNKILHHKLGWNVMLIYFANRKHQWLTLSLSVWTVSSSCALEKVIV